MMTSGLYWSSTSDNPVDVWDPRAASDWRWGARTAGAEDAFTIASRTGFRTRPAGHG
jgi:hypothetical protein